MPNGTLKLYNKLDNTLLVSLDILSTFNIEDNLNETPSNMKVKVITSNTYREEFQVNTVAYHEDTNSWWVIKSDESTYLTTGEYEHEIQLVEYLEFYAYRHLPNCAFAPETYDLEDMLNRLFDIAKLSITVVYPDFLDKDKTMPFFSFENFTVANAIKNIGRAINAIPKMVAGYPYQLFTGSIAFSISPPSSPSNGDYWFKTDTTQLYQRTGGSWVLVTSTIGVTTPFSSSATALRFVNTATSQLFISSNTWTPTLTFINRNGIDAQIKEGLDDEFPIAYEKNMNSNDQFTTRSVSNITNAKSSSLVISPQKGGYKNISPESPQYNPENAVITLPSKIDSIEYMRVFFEVELKINNSIIYKGYYSDENIFYNELRSRLFTNTNRVVLFNGTELGLSTAQYNLLNGVIFSDFPNANEQALLNSTDTIDTGYVSVSERWLKNKMVFKTSFDFNQIDDTAIKERTCFYEKFSNKITMSKTYREGLTIGSSIVDPGSGFVNGYYLLDSFGSDRVYLQLSLNSGSFLFPTKVYTPNALVQVAYYPIADIKISVDNDNDAQDEKYFNQSGKVIDAISVSKLITSHTNDSVEGTKIRNAKYYALNDILPLGQLVRDSNQLYVVSQRSIDGHIKNGFEYFNVVYTLSRNRIARSENIVADSAVISYKTPDDNLVFRTQLYKDYIELSLQNLNQDIPYLSIAKGLILNDTLAGTNFDFTVLAKNSYGTTPTIVRYVKSPSVFDLHKAKLINVNWQSNNILDYRVEDNSSENPIQTPILYTDNVGKATNFELLFLDNQNLNQAISDYNTPYNASTYNPLVPFTDLTQVPTSFYTDDVLADGRFSIRIQEDTSGGRPYKKDPFEIPVFEYMIQGNDDYNSLGNIVIGNDLFSTFTGDVRYRYVINNTTRFTAENAEKLYSASIPPINFNRVTFTRDSGTPHIIDLDLFNTLSTSIRNTSTINNVGIYAFDAGTSDFKFLFAINDYAPISGGINDNSNIRVYINNWKI
jgi:hypothetical protein